MIDASPYQRSPNWQQVKEAGHLCAYLKASEGLASSTEPWLSTQLHDARHAGIQVGLYHYAGDSVARVLHPPHREAAHFLEIAGPHLLDGDVRPALDLEETYGHTWEYLNDWKAQWLAVVDQHIQSLAVFYSYWYFLKQMRLYATRPVWGAYVGPEPPAGTDWWLWQYSFNGAVRGIQGRVDLDRVLGPVPTIPAKEPQT